MGLVYMSLMSFHYGCPVVPYHCWIIGYLLHVYIYLYICDFLNKYRWKDGIQSILKYNNSKYKYIARLMELNSFWASNVLKMNKYIAQGQHSHLEHKIVSCGRAITIVFVMIIINFTSITIIQLAMLNGPAPIALKASLYGPSASRIICIHGMQRR